MREMAPDTRYFTFRLPPDRGARLHRAAKYLGFDSAVAMIKIAAWEKVERAEQKQYEEEMRRDDKKRRKFLPAKEWIEPTKATKAALPMMPATAPPVPHEADVAAPPTKTPPRANGLDAQIDMLASYVEAAASEQEADERLAMVAQIIAEGAETDEDAERALKKLEARAKKVPQ